jgi:hypothetical protein
VAIKPWRLLFLVLLYSCESRSVDSCILFDINDNSIAGRTILYLDSLTQSDSCIYSIESSYLFPVHNNQFYFNGKEGYVKLSPFSGFEQLFSIMENADKAYSINVYQYAWVPDAPDSLQNRVHKVTQVSAPDK